MIQADSLKNLYLKAKLAFNKCMLNPDNGYLKDEINTPINDIILMEDFVCVKFLKYEIDTFVIKVKLQLISPDNRLIGKYFYYENETGDPVDDSLIFDNS